MRAKRAASISDARDADTGRWHRIRVMVRNRILGYQIDLAASVRESNEST
jgi:hypothetical protein